MKINANQLTAHLQKSVAPCYLVTGDEHLLVAEALDAIRDAAREQGFTARDLHVATTGFDWAQLRDSGANLSLFAEKRIVELRLPTGKPGRAGAEAIVDFVEKTGPDLMLVVSGPKLDRSGQASRWAKALDSGGVSVPVWPVELRELPGWIAARMRRVGLQPDREAVSMIAGRVEGNLLAAAQEVEKLRLLLGEGKVTAADVSHAVADSSRYDVFKLADATVGGDARRALRILSGLAAEGVEPVIIIWSLTRELRTLAGLAEVVAAGGDLGRAMQKSGVWRNRQGLVRSCVSRHQRDDFYRLLRMASRADRAAKGQLREEGPWQVLTDLVLDLALAGRKAA